MITQAFVKKYGKGVGVALLTIMLMTLVMLVLCLLVAIRAMDGDVLGFAFGAYFGSMAVTGGAAQAPNFAERLPGERKWDTQHQFDGQQRRVSDRVPGLDDSPREP